MISHNECNITQKRPLKVTQVTKSNIWFHKYLFGDEKSEFSNSISSLLHPADCLVSFLVDSPSKQDMDSRQSHQWYFFPLRFPYFDAVHESSLNVQQKAEQRLFELYFCIDAAYLSKPQLNRSNWLKLMLKVYSKNTIIQILPNKIGWQKLGTTKQSRIQLMWFVVQWILSNSS